MEEFTFLLSTHTFRVSSLHVRWCQMFGGQLANICRIWYGLCGVAGYQRPRSKGVLQALRGEMPAKGIYYQKQLLCYKQLTNSL